MASFPKHKTLLFFIALYVILVASFYLSFPFKEEANSQPGSPRILQVPVRRFSRKRMQELILAEERAEMAVLKGQDPVSTVTPLFAGRASELMASKVLQLSNSNPNRPLSFKEPTKEIPTVSPYKLDLTPVAGIVTTSEKPPASKIVCKRGTANCFIKNLYYVNGRFHLFVPGNSKDKQINMNTGIGFGTPSVLLYVHAQEPPLHFNRVPSVKETTSFFSVMWENFMRTIYGGSGAWYTLMEHSLSTKNVRLILNEPVRLEEFVFLIENVTPFGYQFLSDVPDTRFDVAVVGISRQFRIKEIELEFVEEGDMRRVAFTEFSSAVRNSMIKKSSYGPSFDEEKTLKQLEDPSRPLSVSFVNRNGTRLIVNYQKLVETIAEIPNVNITVYYFENIPFPEQVRIIFESDIVIGMHGAGMAHVFFMRPHATLLELFPYGFRKIVYQNLARMMNVKYAQWQNQKRENTKFNWNYVETHKLTNWTKEEITTRPLDWFNMDSKNYWRQQDSIVDIPSFMDLFKVIVKPEAENYLLYLPSSSSTTAQMIELALACSISSILDRRLVIPTIGFVRLIDTKDENGYKIKTEAFTWVAFEEYTDQSVEYPCRTIALNNFNSLFISLKLASVFHLPGIAANETKTQFKEILHAKIQSLHEISPLKPSRDSIESGLMSKESIQGFASLSPELLGLNSNSEGYSSLASLPAFNEAVATLLTLPDFLKDIQAKGLQKPYVGVHFYSQPGQKGCEKSPETCTTNIEGLQAKLDGVLDKVPAIFLSSLLARDSEELSGMMEWLEERGVEVLLAEEMVKDSLYTIDPLHLEKLQLKMLVDAKLFIGHSSSSFSRLVDFVRSFQVQESLLL